MRKISFHSPKIAKTAGCICTFSLHIEKNFSRTGLICSKCVLVVQQFNGNKEEICVHGVKKLTALSKESLVFFPARFCIGYLKNIYDIKFELNSRSYRL